MYGASRYGDRRRHTIRRQRSTHPFDAIARCGTALTRSVPPGWGIGCQTCARGPHRPTEPGTLRPPDIEPDLPLQVRPVRVVS
jgi:hypothetical protein